VPGRRAQHDRPDRSVGRCVGLCAFGVRIRLRVRSAPSGPNSVPTRLRPSDLISAPIYGRTDRPMTSTAN
jgi:hypothetical protein